METMTLTPTSYEYQTSLAAIMAKSLGRMSQWSNILPSRESAQAAYDAMPPELQQQLAQRAANHGMDAVDLVQRAPQELWSNPEQFETFLNIMDVSHIKSVSEYPDLADDPSNVVWETASTNRARGADAMSGAEFEAANEGASEAARDLTGMDWWTFNDVFKGMLATAGAIGYTAAWLPKEGWKDMMHTIQHELPLVDKETTFSGKFNRARAFALKVRHFFKKHKHQVSAAFMLGCLTLYWPPAQFFVGAWAMTGVLATVTHMFRNQLKTWATKHKFLSFLTALDVPLAKFEWIMSQARSFLDSVKNGIFNLVSKAADMFFGVLKVAMKVVQPHVQKIIKKAKNLVDGFIGWVGSFFNQPRLQAA
jgi:hypothetical protein